MMSPRQLYPTVLIVAVALLASLILHEISVAADRARIGYTSPGPQHGILWVGDVSGIFKKNNLDLEIIYMPGNISIASLLSGEIQFGQMTGAFEAHDHGGVRATHPCACDRGSRPCYYLQLAGEKRHQGFRCALDINEVDVEAVLLEKSHVFGHPKDGRRACIGGNVDKVKFLLSIELVPTAAQQKDD